MDVDLLTLRSTRAILDLVARHDGEFTWYNIELRVGGMDVERIPPAFGVLQELERRGYVQAEDDAQGGRPRFRITEVGRTTLVELNAQAAANG